MSEKQKWSNEDLHHKMDYEGAEYAISQFFQPEEIADPKAAQLCREAQEALKTVQVFIDYVENNHE